MKKIGTSLFILLGAFSLYAQGTGSIIISPAEKFADRQGTLLEKRFDEVGTVETLNIQLEYISDLTNSDKLQCLRFDIQLPNNPVESTALLDTNEVNDLINFLKYISASVIKHPPADPNTEISFTDKYNLQIGCYWQKNNGWVLYLRIDAGNPTTETDISNSNIPTLLKTLVLGKSEM